MQYKFFDWPCAVKRDHKSRNGEEQHNPKSSIIYRKLICITFTATDAGREKRMLKYDQHCGDRTQSMEPGKKGRFQIGGT